MVIRLDKSNREEITDVENLFITRSNGSQIPLSAVANVELKDAPMQISRDNTNRRIVIGVNVGDTDVESLVEKIHHNLDDKIKLPSGYYFTYGGQFENLKAANARLAVAVPLALALIFVLLFFTFKSFTQAALIFTAIPLSAIGGVWALQFRGMPFSISAGIGFIALFGVAVLNGIVLIGYFNQLKKDGMTDLKERILTGTKVRLRPVLMTASVASLGFLPMALSTSGGAEVQRPLATVVIGGLISATILTLLILPILYSWLEQWKGRKAKANKNAGATLIVLVLCMVSVTASAQQSVSLDSAIAIAIKNNPFVSASSLQVKQAEKLSNLKYNLGTTDIAYQGDGLADNQFGQQVNQIGFVQNIPNPAAIKAQNKLNKQKVYGSQINKKITIAELTLQVKNQYFAIQYNRELGSLYERLIALYADYLKKAEVRVSAGDANGLEKLNIRSKLQEYKMLKTQVELTIRNLEKQFQLLLNSPSPISVSDSFSKTGYAVADHTNGLWVQDAQLQSKIESATIDIMKSMTKPDFNAGYAAQKFNEGGWLNAIQIGVSIPLFNGNTKKKIQAQEIKVQATDMQVQAIQLSYEKQLLESRNAIAVYQQGMDFYTNQKNNLNPELERIAKLNYQAGELTYLELLNVLNLVSQTESGYLNQLYKYNKAVALYQFLSTK